MRPDRFAAPSYCYQPSAEKTSKLVFIAESLALVAAGIALIFLLVVLHAATTP